MNALVIDTANSRMLAGTDFGVWLSIDGGASWTHLGPSTGMPNVPVFDLVVRGGQTFAFTHGRGAFMSISPTAAGVEVSGRVMTAKGGSGVPNAHLTITDANGNARTAISNSFGYYRFGDVGAGQVYVIGIASKLYNFTPRVLQVVDNVSGVDFMAEP